MGVKVHGQLLQKPRLPTGMDPTLEKVPEEEEETPTAATERPGVLEDESSQGTSHRREEAQAQQRSRPLKRTRRQGGRLVLLPNHQSIWRLCQLQGHQNCTLKRARQSAPGPPTMAARLEEFTSPVGPEALKLECRQHHFLACPVPRSRIFQLGQYRDPGRVLLEGSDIPRTLSKNPAKFNYVIANLNWSI